MAIAQKNIERIQRMEGYLNDYAKTLEETKKAVDQLREHQESYIQLRDYYSSQAYFDDLDLSRTLGDRNEDDQRTVKSFFIFYLSLGDGGR